jgi:hypothetical protein
MSISKYLFAALALAHIPAIASGANFMSTEPGRVISVNSRRIVVELAVQKGSQVLQSYTMSTLAGTPVYISNYTSIPYISEIKIIDGKAVATEKELKTGFFATIKASIPESEKMGGNRIDNPIAIDIEISDSTMTGNDWAIQEGVIHEKPETSAVTLTKSLILKDGVEMTVPANLLSISRPEKQGSAPQELYSLRVRARKL